MRVFIARYLYGEAKLVEIEVEKETAKSYLRNKSVEAKSILGGYAFYIPGRVAKDGTTLGVFKSKYDALAWLHSQAADDVCSSALVLERAKEQQLKLQKLLNLLEEGE